MPVKKPAPATAQPGDAGLEQVSGRGLGDAGGQYLSSREDYCPPCVISRGTGSQLKEGIISLCRAFGSPSGHFPQLWASLYNKSANLEDSDQAGRDWITNPLNRGWMTRACSAWRIFSCLGFKSGPQDTEGFNWGDGARVFTAVHGQETMGINQKEMFRLHVKRNAFPMGKGCQVTQRGQAGVECFKTRLGKKTDQPGLISHLNYAMILQCTIYLRSRFVSVLLLDMLEKLID